MLKKDLLVEANKNQLLRNEKSNLNRTIAAWDDTITELESIINTLNDWIWNKDSTIQELKADVDREETKLNKLQNDFEERIQEKD